MALKPEQRYTKANPCPICGGYGAYKKENRCKGFRATERGSKLPIAYCQNCKSATALNVKGLILYRHPPLEKEINSGPLRSLDPSSALDLNAGLIKDYQPNKPSSSLTSSYTPEKAGATYAGSDSEVSDSGVLRLPESRPRHILTERRDYPQQGPYRQAESKLWYVVYEQTPEGKREITRSLHRKVAESYVY